MGRQETRDWSVCPGAAAFSCVNSVGERYSTEMEKRAQGRSEACRIHAMGGQVNVVSNK